MNPDKTLTEENYDRYTITSSREILFLLDSLIEHGEPMTVLFNHGADSFITIRLDFDEDADTLIFDWGGSEDTNRRFLKAGSGSFLCHPGGIRVQFPIGPARATEYGGRRAFAVALPRSLLRLQRREFFRINVPLAAQPLCLLETHEGTALNLPMHGVSVAGISFVEAPEAFVGFSQLSRIPRCGFDLGEFGRIECSLEVRYVTPLPNRTGRILARMGCRFAAIRPNLQAHIQRYMIHLESERRARETEF